MSFFKNLFKKQEDGKEASLHDEKPVSVTEVARDLEHMGVTVNIPKGDGSYMRMGGNAPVKEAVEVYNQGAELVSKGKFEQAIEKFKKAAALSPNFTDAHYNLAKNYERFRQYDQAKREYEIVLSLREFDVDALNNLGVIYAMEGRLEKAKDLFDRAVKSNANDAMAHRNLAAYYKAKGDTALMNQYAKRAMELNKDIFNLHLL